MPGDNQTKPKRKYTHTRKERGVQGREKTLQNDTTREPWLQQPNESDKAFQAFQAYLSLPKPRTYKQVADSLQKSGTLIYGWCRQYKWNDRAQAFDSQLVAIRQAAIVESVADRTRRQLSLAQVMQSKAYAGLMLLRPQDIRPRDLAVLAKEGLLLERLISGESTSNIASMSDTQLLARAKAILGESVIDMLPTPMPGLPEDTSIQDAELVEV